MMCANCNHAHTRTEQVVRYTFSNTHAQFCESCRGEDVVESTLMICSEPGCRCYELDPTDYEDRVALIAAGEIDAS